MAIIKLQGEKEKKEGIYYEFDDSSVPLGEGGMGKVYRGRRINMYTREMRDVAIKLCLPVYLLTSYSVPRTKLI